jgi:transcriptional regulator with XRE-family HTH domain
MAAGLTQEGLAERAGLSARGIADLERGTRRSPYAETVERLCSALQLGPVGRDRLLAARRRALMAAVSQHGSLRDRTLLVVALHTGLRAEELCGLKPEHMHLGRRSGHVAVYGKRTNTAKCRSTARRVTRSRPTSRPCHTERPTCSHRGSRSVQAWRSTRSANAR